MELEKLKSGAKIDRSLLLIIVLGIILVIIPATLGFYALNHNIIVLLIVCVILAIYNVLSLISRDLIKMIIFTVIEISWCLINNISSPIITTLFIVPALTMIYDILGFLFSFIKFGKNKDND